MMETIIIAAMTKDHVIGKDNNLPWHIPEDLKSFKNLTKGNTIIMGRKTYDSIGRPLPDRQNIVISRSADIQGVDVCKSTEDAMEKAREYGKDIFIIGGASIYEQMLPVADKMYLSIVKKEYEGDAYFPRFDESLWKIESKEDRGEFELVTYVKDEDS